MHNNQYQNSLASSYHTCTMIAILRESFAMFSLHFLQDARPLFAYSALYSLSSCESAIFGTSRSGNGNYLLCRELARLYDSHNVDLARVQPASLPAHTHAGLLNRATRAAWWTSGTANRVPNLVNRSKCHVLLKRNNMFDHEILLFNVYNSA